MFFKAVIFLILVFILLVSAELVCMIIQTRLFIKRKNLSRHTIKKKKKIDIKDIEEEDFVDKNIIQTYKDDSIPYYVKHNLKKRNKNWNYVFFDDEKVKNFMEKEFGKEILEVLNSFEKGCHKADLFRACWLYRYGGVYIDIDTEITQDLDTVLEMSGKELFSMPCTIEKYYKKRLLNSFIICNKGNPLMKKCIENIVKIDPLELKNNYTLILHVMEETLGDDFKYLFEEKNSYEKDPFLFRRNEWSIYKDEQLIGRSKYQDYDRTNGFKVQ